MTGGIIVSHKDAAHGMLNALRCMYGDIERMTSLSNEGLSTDELSGLIAETAMSFGPEGVCVFVDTYGSSCWRAAKLAGIPNSTVITGFNLPMLLSFVSKRTTIPFSDIPSVLATDAARGIRTEEPVTERKPDAGSACENR